MVNSLKAPRASKAEKSFKNHITSIQDRDGVVVKFDSKRIEDAIFKAFSVNMEGGKKETKQVLNKVLFFLNKRFKNEEIPTIENIQDLIEESLIVLGYADTAKSFILYREQRRIIRENRMSKEEVVDLIGDYVNVND
jgi:anaerobic ribonucleoside-triphosphate reductase